MLAQKRPVLSAASLALAVSIKVWPAFFLPYLIIRGRWKVVAATMAFVVLFSVLPSVYFGFAENSSLLRQWFLQEFRTQLSENEIWFPNQSLRGVMMRYLTVIDYSQVPDSNYPQVNILSLAPDVVRTIWAGVAVAVYAGFLWLANRRRSADGWLDNGLAFCLIALLEPFTQKYVLSVLLWPAAVLGTLTPKSQTPVLLYGATVLVWIQRMTPERVPNGYCKSWDSISPRPPCSRLL